MNLLFGSYSIQIEKKETEAELFEAAIQASMEKGYVKKGDLVVLTAGVPLGTSGNTNMIRVTEV